MADVFFLVTDGMQQRQAKPEDVFKDFSGGAFADALALQRPTDLAVVSKLISVGPVAAKSANSVAAAFAGNAASNTITLQASPSPATPRNVRLICAASWDGGDVTVTGTDQFDEPCEETLTGVATQTTVGVKIFKTITGAVKSAVGSNGATSTLGTGDNIGLPVAVANAVAFLWVVATPEAVTISTTHQSFTPTTTPSTTTFTLLVNV